MVKLLDCTLRDGGYYTNWDFDKKLIQKYFQYIENLPVDYIEVGYRSILKKEYLGEYFYLPLSTMKYIKQHTSKELSLMLNSKDCYNVNLQGLLSDVKEYISFIRIATDPNKIEFSIELSKELKKLGFKVALNIMYISKLDKNHKLFDFLEDIGQYTDYLYLVDSYGSIYPDELEVLIKRIKKKTNIPLGFHGHNNLELVLINTLKAIECGVKLVDSTILGMGRGAGNLKTELFLIYMKSKLNIRVNLNSLGKLIELFKPLQEKYNWGSNLAYMVSGSYSLPQKDVMDALEINRYSLLGIVNQIKHEEEIKLPIFKSDKNISQCLIIGGGKSIVYSIKAIKELLEKKPSILLIHSTSKYINLFENIKNSQYFAVAGDELLKLNSTPNIDKYILEPSPRKVDSTVHNTSNFYELEKIDFINNYSDSPLTISLQIALNINANNIYLAGFDGYIQLHNKKELYLMQENQTIINSFKQELTSLTKSKYDNLQYSSIYGLII